MKYIREHINEKFTQESDPIHDLGIGDFGKIAKKVLESMPEENCQSAYDKYFKQYGDVNFFNEEKRFKTSLVRIHWHTLIEISDNPFKTIDYYNEEFRKVYLYEFNGEKFTQSEKEKILDKVIEIIEAQIGLRLSYEYPILEKFTQDSDPVSDLGIGHPFANLKIGDVLVVKKQIRSVPTDNSMCSELVFGQSVGGQVTGTAGFIKQIKEIKDKLFLRIVFFPSEKRAVDAVKYFNGLSVDSLYMTEGTATYDTWNEYFNIVKT